MVQLSQTRAYQKKSCCNTSLHCWWWKSCFGKWRYLCLSLSSRKQKITIGKKSWWASCVVYSIRSLQRYASSVYWLCLWKLRTRNIWLSLKKSQIVLPKNERFFEKIQRYVRIKQLYRRKLIIVDWLCVSWIFPMSLLIIVLIVWEFPKFDKLSKKSMGITWIEKLLLVWEIYLKTNQQHYCKMEMRKSLVIK